MKNYQTLPINRWSIPRFKAVSDDAKVLLLYLSINSDTGLLNLPPWSMEGIAIDLGWRMERIKRRLSELMAHQLIDLGDDKQELFIKPYLSWRKLDKPLVIPKANSITEASTSWRESVRATLYGVKKQQEQRDVNVDVAPTPANDCESHLFND